MNSRIACLLLCLVTSTAWAQDTTVSSSSLPFRGGQWAAHFALGGFGGIGVSRFSSPRRALLLQINLSAIHDETITESPISGREVDVASGATVTARLGRRTYRSGSPRVTPYFTLGPLVSLTHSYFASSGQSQSADGWSLGIFGDLGALYHVTSNLALGAAGSADVRYGHTSIRASNGARATNWDIGVSGVTVSAGLTLMF